MPIIVALLICGIITKEKKNALCEIIKPKRNIFYKLTWYLGSVRFGLKYFMENEFCFLFYLVHLEFVSQRKILSWPMDFFFFLICKWIFFWKCFLYSLIRLKEAENGLSFSHFLEQAYAPQHLHPPTLYSDTALITRTSTSYRFFVVLVGFK